VPDLFLFPVACPLCKEPAGWPKSIEAVVRDGEQVIAMHCKYCQHEWREKMAVRMSAGADSGKYRRPY